jgi:hypothetical protein
MKKGLREPRRTSGRRRSRGGGTHRRSAAMRSAMAIAVVATAALGLTTMMLFPASGPGVSGQGDDAAQPRAVIVDQLAVHYQDPEFREAVVEDLIAAGYETEVVPARDATVDTLRSLPLRDANIMILRTH